MEPETPAAAAPPLDVIETRLTQPEPAQICSVLEALPQRMLPEMLDPHASVLAPTWTASEAEMVPVTSSLALGLVVPMPTLPFVSTKNFGTAPGAKENP